MESMRKIALTLLILVSTGLIFFVGWRQGMFVGGKEKNVREPAVAGNFYPADKTALQRMIENLLQKAEFRNHGRLRGLVVPHAGYMFSGEVAAWGFKQIPSDVHTVIILGPSHHFYFEGASISNYTHYRTPLGEVEVSEKVKLLKQERLIKEIDDSLEHSIEVELPFLQQVLKDFRIIPIMTGFVDPEKLAEVLMKYVDNDTLLIVSSDLSHYHPYEIAKQLDEKCIQAISEMDVEKAKECEACGKIPILTLMYLAKKMGWYAYPLQYKNSGDVTGDRRNVVGYAAIGFYEGVDKRDQQLLLKLARETLESYLKNGSLPRVEVEKLSPKLKEMRGCFVTLYKNGMLRGCIGSLLPLEPLYQCVIRNSINAALHDLRFPSVRYEELKEIKIEISVLTVPKKLEFKDSEELLEKLKGNEGVILKLGGRQATYLPQVWKHFPEKQEFLSHLCMKAGLAPGCWEEGAEIEIYHAQVFDEH